MISIRSLLLASLAAATASAQCVRNATVVDGDTCDAISIKYASSTYQLALANPSIDDGCSNLEIGQQVCLGMKGEDCSKIYKVVPNDTCDGISAQYGLANTTLYLNNPQINSGCTNIYVGEVLCVDTAVYPYASASAFSSMVASQSQAATSAAAASATPASSSRISLSAPAAQGTTVQVNGAAASITPSSTSAPAASASATDDDASADDEDDLPYCDEE